MTPLFIVHLARAGLRYVGDKDAAPIVGSLKLIYRAATVDDAARALDALEEK